MSDAPSRFPLAWPAHRPRKSWTQRKSGKFSADGSPITIAKATQRVLAEVGRMSASYPLISSNVELKVDGLPKSGKGQPTDPGVCVYFQLRGKPYAMACDSYDRVEQNLAAVAAHLEATRAIERHGVATAAETLQAFSALPPPNAEAAPRMRPWREVLGFMGAFPDGLTAGEARSVVDSRFRDRARGAHPDTGGSAAAMSELNAARSAALKEIGA